MFYIILTFKIFSNFLTLFILRIFKIFWIMLIVHDIFKSLLYLNITSHYLVYNTVVTYILVVLNIFNGST